MRPEFSGQPSHPTESPWASLQTRGLTRGSAWRHKHATVVTVPGLPGPRPREVRVPAHDHVPGRRRVEEANLLIHTVTRRAPSWCPPCHGPSHTVPRWPARRERGQRALTGFCQSLGLCLRLLRPPLPQGEPPEALGRALCQPRGWPRARPGRDAAGAHSAPPPLSGRALSCQKAFPWPLTGHTWL